MLESVRARLLALVCCSALLALPIACRSTVASGGDVSDASHHVDGQGPAPGNFHDVTSAANWSFHDLALAGGRFAGGTYDGRYVYLAPDRAAPYVARYDTKGPFDDSSSWSTFSLLKLGGAAGTPGGGGATFDGRYIYFANSDPTGIVLRYDPETPFDQKSSWTVFSVTAALGSGLGRGSAFDGRYVYFAAGGYEAAGVVRFDTQAGFTEKSSWSMWKSNPTLQLRQAGDTGVVFDGRYVYLVPAGYPLLFYDTQADFALDASWSERDVPVNNPEFFGAAFDGHYLYLVPYLALEGDGIVQRFDPQKTNTSPWLSFDTATLSPGSGYFMYAGFDGRFVYLVPNYSSVTKGASGLLVWFDTQGDFTSVSSWAKFDLTTLNVNAKQFVGAIFDGRYLYFAPGLGTVARFDARDPPAMPPLPAFHGSFF
jgi:hypothetical protein